MHPINYLNILINLIIEQYFNNSICIIYTHDKPDAIINLQIPKILLEKNITEVNLDEQQICKHFVMYYNNASEAFSILEDTIKFESRGMYNTRRYLIIIDSEEEFEDFFNSTALNFIRDVLIVFMKNEHNYNIDNTININKFLSFHNITQFDLYTHKYVGVENNNDAILLDSWDALNQSFLYGNNLYPDKISNQFGRELRAPCFILLPYAYCMHEKFKIGNEQNVIIKYSERYNYTLNLYMIGSFLNDYGTIFENWTGSGPVYGLYDNDNKNYRDIVFGGFPKVSNNLDLVRTVIYSYEVYAPIPEIKYGWLTFCGVFTSPVWFFLFAVYVTARSLVYLRKEYLLKQLIDNKKIKTTSGGLTNLSMFGLLVNQPGIVNSDIKESKFFKYIIMLLLVTSVLLVTAYNSRLSSVMVSPIYVNDVQTLDELAESNYKILFFDDYFHILKADERQVYKTLYNKCYLIPNNTDYELSLKLLNSRKFAVGRYRRSSGKYFEQVTHLEQMYGNFKPVVPELYKDYYYFLLRKNSMHTNELFALVQTATEAGLMKFWEEDALRRQSQDLFQMKISEFKMGNDNIDLNLHHLKGCFAFWGVGLAIAFFVFLKEILYYKPKLFPYQN